MRQLDPYYKLNLKVELMKQLDVDVSPPASIISLILGKIMFLSW